MSQVCNQAKICQIVRSIEVCDQNGDRVSKNHKSWHMCSKRQKGVSSLIWKIWGSVYKCIMLQLYVSYYTIQGKSVKKQR